ncbi:PPR repeat [Musa troglodytarum]|uniref:PPR repeat n=1 Tax=Musa troglodytarum TaxID=320322 RepID=A0A9E7ET25_9LILI|nr:PPR repeat [Musa troglodytarum]
MPLARLPLHLLRSTLRFSSIPKPLQALAIPSPASRPAPLPVAVPRIGPDSALVSTPDAESICSLLSNPPSDRPPDLDGLLVWFERKLTSDLVLEVLKCHRRLGRSATLGFFSWAGFRLGFRFDDPVVEYMADFLGRRKLFDDLKWLLRTVARSNGRVSTRSVAICIRFLGRQGRVGEALSLFEVMELELNCPPDNLVINNVLYVLCKKDLSGGSIDVAVRIFHRIVQPDMYSYSNIIIGLCRFGRLENAFEVLREMTRATLVPTRTAVNTLIRELCQFGGKDELVGRVSIRKHSRPFDILVPNLMANGVLRPAVEVFHMIARLGLLPSTYIVDILVLRLCQAGKIEEAMGILGVVEGSKPNSVAESYTIIIKALCEACRMDEACRVLGRMMNLGLKPKLIVYNSIIRAFCMLGNVVEAQKYFDIMNKRRCEPDRATYTMLVHANCMIQNWQIAYKLLMEMIGLGRRPHFDTYNLVDGFLKKNGELDMSNKLKRKMEVQDLYAHCKAGRLEAAYDKLSSMLAMGFRPPIYARDAFECAFRKSPKWKVAQELLKKMEVDHSPFKQQQPDTEFKEQWPQQLTICSSSQDPCSCSIGTAFVPKNEDGAMNRQRLRGNMS